MTTSAVSGSTAKVSVNGAPLGELRNFEITPSLNLIDATSVDSSGWEENIPGRKSWSASAEAFYIDADAGQQALRDALTGQTLLSFSFNVKTGTGLNQWQGQGYIQNWKLNPSENAAVAFNVSIKGSGALTESNQ